MRKAWPHRCCWNRGRKATQDWLRNVNDFYLELGIPDPFVIKMAEKGWKTIMKKAILKANEKHEIIVKYKKLENSELC